ncbi:MAG TPA: hypothetical protein PKD12_08205 [Nitrospira sp.]|nr:hypothetical protein [Nitrospira sp.]
MAPIVWDAVGARFYETGVDQGVLYDRQADGTYTNGVAWNGLTTVTESPSGAESNKQYADNQVYLNLLSLEQFGGTIEAFTYPTEFEKCDGSIITNGVSVGQQPRATFGLAYRTKFGDDVAGDSGGYKIHLLYGCLAAPSEKAFATINDSPEVVTFSWEVSSTPVAVAGKSPTSVLVINSRTAVPARLTALLDILYGTSATPRLPLPDEVATIMGTGVTNVDLGIPANQPSYVSGTHIITLPAVTGVQWKINGVNKSSGAQPALTVGQVANVLATPTSGYNIIGDTDWVFNY